MEKGRSATEGPRIDGLNIHDYKLREYLCVFDRKENIPNRLRSLAIGLQLYSKYDLSRDQFIEFHRNRQSIVRAIMVATIWFLIFVEALVLYKLPSWTGREIHYGVGTYFGAAFIAWFIYYTVKTILRTVRANFTHINTALSSNTCLKLMQAASVDDHSFFQALEEGVKKSDFDIVRIASIPTASPEVRTDKGEKASQVSTNVLDGSGGGNADRFVNNLEQSGRSLFVEVAENSDFPDTNGASEDLLSDVFDSGGKNNAELPTFQNQLIELSRQQNKFNDLPMTMVIDFFNVMCCPECKYKVPQMAENDFIRFINAAFLGQKLDGKIRLSNSHNRKMLTREIFHQFMNHSLSYLKLPPSGASERYRRLLYDHFEGYGGKDTADNFRTEIDDRLEKLRNDYKTELQFLQWLQTAKRQ